jgi:hypothetical protein
MRKSVLIFAFFIVHISIVSGQGLGGPGTIKDDGTFAASTKQMNQFFRRFNGEESIDGTKRFYPEDSLFQNEKLRKGFVSILFDNQTSEISSELKNEFISTLISPNFPQYVVFHKPGWIAEVDAVFSYQGKKEKVTFIMKIQPEGLGYEWVIDQVIFDPFKDLFNKPVGQAKDFLHPLSHELGFMNMRRAFQDSENPESFTSTTYSPDYLAIFLFEMKQNNLRFETVNGVKFHFFQIGGWYFEVNQFNRPGLNTGWLISNLMRLGPGDKETLLRYIYDQD